jgi:hypothetical protein
MTLSNQNYNRERLDVSAISKLELERQFYFTIHISGLTLLNRWLLSLDELPDRRSDSERRQ